jgi:hypothetical protein
MHHFISVFQTKDARSALVTHYLIIDHNSLEGNNERRKLKVATLVFCSKRVPRINRSTTMGAEKIKSLVSGANEK